MRILVDINHPVDINFFKNSILELKRQGCYVHIVYRNRGRLEKILKYELEQFPISKFGDHKKSFVKKVIAQLERDFSLISFIKKKKFDLVICFGATSAISSRLCGVPYLAFDDDFEYKIPFYHANWFSTRHVFPDFIDFENSKTHKYHGFKELAYLSPKYLNVSEKVLNEYAILSDQYVFIREVAHISLNYKDGTSILSNLIRKIKAKNLVVVLSIENKELANIYSDDCIILEEPVSDIYSLLYHAQFAISSGDTVAREAALLGVPTLYTGGREMIVNKPLVKSELMIESNNINEIEKIIDTFTIDRKRQSRKKSSNLITTTWDDTTAVILQHVKDFMKKK